MGWFDSLFGESTGADPLAKLDPKLRDYLRRESPVKYATEEEQQHKQNQPEQIPEPQEQNAPPAEKPLVPPQSLFPDGRYAHLWKTYRPLAEIEAETKTDHEKLMDVLDAYKGRKAQIGRAALENCADEQMDWAACMKGGEWTDRMTMCRKQVQRFERCYMTQSRLLKALGYLSNYERPPEVDEDIQMRADDIFQRMIRQEEEVARAKAEGRPVPVFAPLVPKAPAPVAAQDKVETIGAVSVTQAPSAQTVREWQLRLDKLPEEDRAAELEALKADWKAKAEVATQVQGLWKEQAEAREARKAEGKETIADKVKGVFGR
ncbi:hypothetical protein QBC39DRAFT_370646 [Podospora conica]|nr:hypothetical protein QBC39DRAFT_370646 [Schizothecium conicum]